MFYFISSAPVFEGISSSIETAIKKRVDIFQKLNRDAAYFSLVTESYIDIYKHFLDKGYGYTTFTWLYPMVAGFTPSDTFIPVPKTDFPSTATVLEPEADKTICIDNGIITTYYSNKGNLSFVDYSENNRKTRRDYYHGGLVYSAFYGLDEQNMPYTEFVRFYDNNAEQAFDVYSDSVLYPSGVSISKSQFFQNWLKSLSSDDTIIIDRLENEYSILDVLEAKQTSSFKLFETVHSHHLVKSFGEATLNPFYKESYLNNQLFDGFICLTKEQAQALPKDLERLTGTSCPCYVAPSYWLGDCTDSSIRPEPYSFVTVSALNKDKGVDTVISAITYARSRGYPVTLDIYGIGQEYRNLAQQVEDANAQDYIKFKGYCSDVISVLPNYQTYITATKHEAGSHSLIEACCSGCAMIGYDVEYSINNVIDETNGYLLPVGADLGEKVVEFLHEDVGLFRLGSRFKAGKFGLDEIAQHWTIFINQINP